MFSLRGRKVTPFFPYMQEKCDFLSKLFVRLLPVSFLSPHLSIACNGAVEGVDTKLIHRFNPVPVVECACTALALR